jgi:hypothetical protein
MLSYYNICSVIAIIRALLCCISEGTTSTDPHRFNEDAVILAKNRHFDAVIPLKNARFDPL